MESCSTSANGAPSVIRNWTCDSLECDESNHCDPLLTMTDEFKEHFCSTAGESLLPTRKLS